MQRNVATLLVDLFESYGVEYVFCVPGASIDAITTALLGRKPKLILCRQESGAGNMAVAYAKKTGKPGVVIVTAGPGATNLVTAAATATLEHAPLIAISGQMDSKTTFKPSHQIINAEDLFLPVTKYSKEVTNSATVTGVWDLAYQKATTGEHGAVHLAFASDLLAQAIATPATNPLLNVAKSQAMPESVVAVAKKIEEAKFPVLIIGGDAASIAIADSLEQFICKTKIAAVCTFEGGGVIKPAHLEHFMGRIGVFQNQPCNQLMEQADLIICLGYNIAELDPIKWNAQNRSVIHVAEYLPIVADGYRPDYQLLGDIATNISQLCSQVDYQISSEYINMKHSIRQQLTTRLTDYQEKANLVHPLYVIKCLQEVITVDDSLISDVGSHQYWLSEYFVSHTPRQYINSMGFQTLGVSLAFAAGAAFSQHGSGKVYSVSGDGGVLMCIMELATAVEYQLPIIHLVWKDHSYNLVAIQEDHKYHETSAVQFTHNIDFVQMAQSFGAHGISVTKSEELMPAIEYAQTLTGPVVIDILIDYADNLHKLVE